MKKQFRDFESARKFVRRLRLKGVKEWYEYCKSGNKPEDIPQKPERTYKDKGWIGFGDWLGTGNVANLNRQFRTFKEARKFVRALKLKNTSEWYEYCKSGNKPEDIPAGPFRTYKKEWKGIGDWIGTGKIASQKKVYRSFKEARKFVHKLKLKSLSDWEKYCKSGNKPDDIPVAVWSIYKNELISMGDFLGTGTIATQKKSQSFLSAKEAKPILKKLFKEHDIKNLNEWKLFAKNHNKLLEELHIPSKLTRTYSKQNAERKSKK
jgi:hypothetical protein